MTERTHGPSGSEGPLTPVRFPPLPLLSGDALIDASGTHLVSAVTVSITCTDGTSLTVRLDQRYGGWWPPDAPPEVEPADTGL